MKTNARRARNAVAVALMLLSGPVVAVLDAAPAVGASSSLVISEFRVRGPNGANDEFIEIGNISASDHTVAGGGAGYAVAASNGVARCVIPNGTVIPRLGHYLCVNSIGYSLASYPAGNGTTATGDATYTTDIPDNAGIAIFNTSVAANFVLANRIDAVGSTSEANTVYKEGTGYPALTPFSIDYSFYRSYSTGSITTMTLDTTTPGVAKDTDNNAADFIFVDTNGTSAGAGQRLGAPGPENLSSPVGGGGLTVGMLDPCVSSDSPPNVVRDFTSDPANNSTFGTYSFMRTVTNNTGQAVTRLRFRIADIRTFPAPSGFADMRPRTSTSASVTVDRAPCGSGTSTVTVQGTTLEQPPSQPNGGGFNSSWSAGTITLSTPLANGASIDVRLLTGIQQNGDNGVRFFAEALPSAGSGAPTLACAAQTSGTSESMCNVPLAADDTYAASEDTVLNVAAPGVLGNDTDPPNPSTTFTAQLVTNASHGAVTLNSNGSFSYTPAVNFNGVDSFTYKAVDGTSESVPATVTLNVAGVNDAPAGGDDSFTTYEDDPLIVSSPGLLANDSDPEANAISVVPSSLAGPAYGSATLNSDGSFTYVPGADFNGTDTFSYRVTDGVDTSGPINVSVDVTPVPEGYIVASPTGDSYQFGDVSTAGSTGPLTRPIVGAALTPSGMGHWLVATDGGIFSYGDAGFYGSTGDITLNQPIVGMASSPTGQGYWLVARDGGIFTYGDAEFFGSTGDIRLNQPIVGMASSPTGKGYWLVARDGGIFTFGDAVFHGSTGDIRLNQPVVGMASTVLGDGYWLVASDGGIFTFGAAVFHGSAGDIRLNQPIIGMTPTSTGGGYWLVARDAGVFTFGDAPFLGSAADGRKQAAALAG